MTDGTRQNELSRHLAREIERHRRRAPRTVFTIPVPVAPAEVLLRLDPAAPAIVWEPPGGPSYAGLGEAWRVDLAGSDRFDTLEVAAAELGPTAVVPHPEAPAFVPALFGGLAFEPAGTRPRAGEWRAFGDGCFILPRWTYVSDGTRAVLALALSGGDDDGQESGHLQRFERLWRALDRPPELRETPPPRPHVLREMPADQWSDLVEAARAAIAAGAFDKVVLARQTVITLDAAAEPAAILARLRDLQPDAFRFAFRRGPATFLGATPEPLLVKRGRTVLAEALAGTWPHAGPDPGERLVRSAKDRAEHAFVIAAIREGLAPFCAQLSSPPEPQVRTLRDVLHLSTPVRGELSSDTPVSRLLATLHPTPAIGGHPRQAALRFIAAHEPLERGWYAGPVGRIGADGDGEFAVAIRSALCEGRAARVFAGAGIVDGSDPRREFEETAAKERTILSALGEWPRVERAIPDARR